MVFMKKVLNGHSLELSHLDKVFFPRAHLTKGDVIDYYEKIADYLLPHIKGHPIVMHRYPNGIADEGFYQKEVPDYFPSWIHRKTVPLKKGEHQTLVVIDDSASLVYLANQGVLVFHSWLSSADAIHTPNKIVFDLDPSGHDVDALKDTARKIKKILEHHSLKPYVMTTGSRGYHIVTPLIPEHSFEAVHEFAKHIAEDLVKAEPHLYTVEINKEKRKGKIFIDYLRNSYGQTSVACYSLREHEGAPVATPLDWAELTNTDPQTYTIKNILKRLSQKDDPWKDFEKHARKLVINYSS